MLDEILVDDAVGSGKEGKDIGYNMKFVDNQLVRPAAEILVQSVSSPVQNDALAFLYTCSCYSCSRRTYLINIE